MLTLVQPELLLHFVVAFIVLKHRIGKALKSVFIADIAQKSDFRQFELVGFKRIRSTF